MTKKKSDKPGARPATITQQAYAKRRGVSKQYIGKLVREGVLPLVDGKINPAQADAILDARREPARSTHQQKQAVQVPGSTRQLSPLDLPTLLLKTRIKSESEKAKLLEIKAKVESGKFVDVDEVKSVAFRRGRTVRDNLLAIPDRLDAVLAAESDRRRVHKILTDELTRVLEELSKPLIR